MARPKKNKLSEAEVDASTPGVELPVITPVEKPESVIVEPSTPIPAPVVEAPEEAIQPEADRYEMNRYFCVINTSNEASRISETISHQRDLEMWGVHQYDKNRSRNSYARSFYFKNRLNALKALDHANKLLDL